MTIQKDIWVPDLSQFDGPKYRAIAAALGADIRSGRLAPGDRLPPQRELAWALEVTVGTITRAYQEAERKGLVAGEVGRGTYVRPAMDHNKPVQLSVMPSDWYNLEQPEAEDDPSAPISMQFNFPPGNVGVTELRRMLVGLSEDPGLARLLWYQPPTGDAHQLQAAENWFGRRGLAASAGNLVICSGAHNGILATLSALCGSGGRVATERLVYPGLRAIARLLGLELVPVDMDGEGMTPDALDMVLSVGGIDAVYTVPTLHNPTNRIQSAERREALAEILARHGVPVVEDDLFGMLPTDAPKPLSSWLPDLGYCITSLSKTLAPGLRVGYIRCPEKSQEQIAAGVRGSTWMAAPLTVEIASRWILDGTADRLMAERQIADQRRRDIIRDILSDYEFDMPDGALHAWLHLPDPWHASQFVSIAKEEGVTLSAAHAFTIGRDRPPFAVRVCLGPPRTEQRLTDGLTILRDILSARDPNRDNVVM